MLQTDHSVPRLCAGSLYDHPIRLEKKNGQSGHAICGWGRAGAAWVLPSGGLYLGGMPEFIRQPVAAAVSANAVCDAVSCRRRCCCLAFLSRERVVRARHVLCNIFLVVGRAGFLVDTTSMEFPFFAAPWRGMRNPGERRGSAVGNPNQATRMGLDVFHRMDGKPALFPSHAG